MIYRDALNFESEHNKIKIRSKLIIILSASFGNNATGPY